MNAIVQTNTLVGHFNEFFAPVEPNLLQSLLKQYAAKKAVLERLDATMKNGKIQSAMIYFLKAHKRKTERDGGYSSVAMAYDLEAAIATLDAEFWELALNLTDVKNHMNQDRRTEWWEMIRECKCEPFEQEIVINTIKTLLLDRARFLAEGVDGMFRKLSGEHVTNSPSGFNKRMIMANVLDPKWDSIDSTRSGYIDDLRKIIAKFMGREYTNSNGTYDTLLQMRRHFGEWVTWDGGSMRVRLYKKGTVHIEVHPDIAWRLNTILAYLYPAALTEGSLKKPTRASKDFDHIMQPLSFQIINCLSELIKNRSLKEPIKLLSWRTDDIIVKAKVKEVLFSLGGTMTQVEHRFDRYGKNYTVDAVEFDYDPTIAISHVIISGCLPDKKSHQYYPTPEPLAAELVEWAEIDDTHTVLEPSAGQGGLADLFPKEATIKCVEVSKLHCKILESKGYTTLNLDFLEHARASSKAEYDRIVMNPPFSEGRAKLHLEAAITCLKSSGIITAILPSSMKNKEIASLDTFEVEWSEIRHNEFADASVSVVLMKAVRG